VVRVDLDDLQERHFAALGVNAGSRESVRGQRAQPTRCKATIGLKGVEHFGEIRVRRRKFRDERVLVVCNEQRVFFRDDAPLAVRRGKIAVEEMDRVLHDAPLARTNTRVELCVGETGAGCTEFGSA